MTHYLFGCDHNFFWNGMKRRQRQKTPQAILFFVIRSNSSEIIIENKQNACLKSIESRVYHIQLRQLQHALMLQMKSFAKTTVESITTRPVCANHLPFTYRMFYYLSDIIMWLVCAFSRARGNHFNNLLVDKMKKRTWIDAVSFYCHH